MNRNQILKMIFSVIMPPILVVALFVVAIGAIIIPATEDALMQKKQDMLQAIVMSATSIIEKHAQMERDGLVTKEEAQKTALTEMRALRYGSENQDYLWIIDLEPRMVMHPFFPTLEGTILDSYADTEGKLLFVEAVKIAENEGAGYIDYMWPKQDNINEPVAKLSYIRLFEQWGWVVGSGVYLDDVYAEIKSVTYRLFITSAWIGSIVLFILFFIIWRGLKSETGRCRAETELFRSRERYQALAHASGEMVFLTIDGMIAGANKMACDALGLLEEEIVSRKFSEFVVDNAFMSILPTEKADRSMEAVEAFINGKNGPERMLFSVEPAIVHGSPAILYAGYPLKLKDAPAKSFISYESLNQSGFGMLKLDNTLNGEILSADRLATELIIGDSSGSIVGKSFKSVVEESDANRLFIQLNAEKQVRNLLLRFPLSDMTTGYLQASASMVEDTTGLGEQIIVIVTDATEPQSVMKASDALLSELLSPEKKVSICSSLLNLPMEEEDLSQRYMRTQVLLRQSVRMGLSAEKITAAMTHSIYEIFNYAAKKAIVEIGPPPCRYALLAFGSIGRHEPTLNADQDTAIIFESKEGNQDFSDYFQRLGASINSNSGMLGIPPSNSGNTAANPAWCLSDTAWRKQFSSWINSSQPEDLILVNIFFDFQAIVGDGKLADDLRQHIFKEVEKRPVFLYNLAQDTLSFRSPFVLLGRIRSDSQSANFFNLKGSMLHFVNFARIYSLRYAINETNTIKRLQTLKEKGHIPTDTGQDTMDAWRFLLDMRYQNQVTSMELNFPQENILILENLSSWEDTMLKKALGQVNTLQKRISSDIIRMG
ncbi:MAG: cache domain-containing protein [Bacillota bacterium]